MNARAAVLVMAALLTGGCLSSFSVGLHAVSGTVRYRDGAPVNHAKVWTEDGTTTFSDAQGRFRIFVRANGHAILHAGDGYAPDTAYAETCYGSAFIDPTHRSERKDIVLTYCGPI